MKKERTEMNECWSCVNKRPVPGNRHIECSNPDPEMTGSEYGIKSGWFNYPSCFDPTWKTKMCSNFSCKDCGGSGEKTGKVLISKYMDSDGGYLTSTCETCDGSG